MPGRLRGPHQVERPGEGEVLALQGHGGAADALPAHLPADGGRAAPDRGIGRGGGGDPPRVAQRDEAAVAPAGGARVVAGHDAVVVARVGAQARDARADAARALPAAGAGVRGALAVAGGRPVLEVVGRGAAVGVDRGRQPRGDRGDVARRARRRARRPGTGVGLQRAVRAARDAGRVGRDDAVVVGGVVGQPGQGGRRVDCAGARARVDLGGLQAVARGRPVLEAVRRRHALGVDGAADRGAALGDAARGAGRGARRPARRRRSPGRAGPGRGRLRASPCKTPRACGSCAAGNRGA